MNTPEVLSLLSKYYNGETSDEEDLILRRYFTEGIVPPELESEKELFCFYTTREEVPLPSPGFEERIISAIDRQIEDGRRNGFVIGRKLITALSSAAAILLVIGSYFIYIHKNEPADTFSDPSIAYAETLKILYNVSESLNTGVNALEPVGNIESEAAKSIGTLKRSATLIEENLRSLNYLEKAITIVNSPFNINVNK